MICRSESEKVRKGEAASLPLPHFLTRPLSHCLQRDRRSVA